MRFPIVIEALNELKRQRPECDSEVEIAKGMILGKRPGIEEKYDALLLKLDRSYSRLLDQKERWQKVADEAVAFQARQKAKAKVTALNMILVDLQWMRARNRDMIQAAQAVQSKPDDPVSL